MNKTPLEYGELALEAVMHKYTAKKLPPENSFFYHQGVFLSGMEKIYFLSGKRKYFDYIKEYVDHFIDENGRVKGIDYELLDRDAHILERTALEKLDNKQPVILMYNLFNETGDEKYANAIKSITQSMRYWPVNEYGGYWHMMTQHNQMWMDGAYMAGPLSVMYANRFGDTVLRERAIKQVFIMDDFIKDKKSGLYFHGWDPSKKAEWADPKTGLSQEIWGRALGWYTVAILDILDYIPKDHPAVERLKQIELDLLRALVKYQDKETGLWYQVTDKPEKEGNWVETSCTNLFIYSYAKAMRMGVADISEFEAITKKAYKGIEERLYLDDEGYLVVDNVCEGTCIDSGTYEHYIGRKKINNDLHGMGAFTLMCAEMEKYTREVNKI